MRSQLFSEIRSHRVSTARTIRTVVHLTETFDSRDVAGSLWSSPATQEAMANDGIDMTSLQIDYLDEIDSGTH